MSSKRALDGALDPPSFSHPASLSADPSPVRTKKVKFQDPVPSGPSVAHHASPDDPNQNQNDLPYDSLNRVGKGRRGTVKVDGYDSDSSTENSQLRTDKDAAARALDQDGDMFGSEEDQKTPNAEWNRKFEKVDAGMALKKGAEEKDYLDLGDIEGQEFGRGEDDDGDDDDDDDDDGDAAGHGRRARSSNARRAQGDAEHGQKDAYSDEEEDYVPGDEFANDDDAPRARRKSKKGMGFVISKFNMAEELKEGRMAADGSYVASAKDPDAVHDNWLEGLNKKAIKQAREAKKKRDEEILKRATDEEGLASHRSRKDCYLSVLSLLPPNTGQSVSQILVQLGNEKKSRQTLEKKKTAKKVAHSVTLDSSMAESSLDEHDQPRSTDAAATSDLTLAPKTQEQFLIDQRIAQITDLASVLMSTHGDLDIYDMTHGSITGILKSEGLVPRDWVAPYDNSLLCAADDSNHSKPECHLPRKSLISRPTTTAEAIQSTPPATAASIYYRFKSNASTPSAPPDNGAIYGPFERVTMESWASQGFFGPEFNLVDVKNDTSSDGSAPWGSWQQTFP